MIEQLSDELDVFFPACGQLAEGNVVLFQAQADRACRIVDLEFNKALLPAIGKCGGFRRYAVSVVTELLVKR